MDIPPTSVAPDVPDSPDAPDVADTPARGRRRIWPWVVVVAVTGLFAGILFIPTPYYLFEPGSVRPTEGRIAVTGHRAFATKGQVLFTTIGIQQATVADLVRGWLDDAIEIEGQHDVYPQGKAQDRVENQAAMDSSKMVAISVAFHQVGYDVKLTGTGAFISEVLPGFPASKQLKQGEVITAVDGRPVHLASDLSPALAAKQVGDTVTLTVREARGTKERTETVQLGRNKDDTSRGYLGVAVETADSGLDLPFDIEIDSGQVTGPSAGLAWTLGLIDRLTPGSLTGGREVAVTGTIAPDGSVGPIGGIVQKMATVKRAGVKEFIFPKDTDPKELAQVRKIAGRDVVLHQVATIGEALKVLAPRGVPAAPPLS